MLFKFLKQSVQRFKDLCNNLPSLRGTRPIFHACSQRIVTKQSPFKMNLLISGCLHLKGGLLRSFLPRNDGQVNKLEWKNHTCHFRTSKMPLLFIECLVQNLLQFPNMRYRSCRFHTPGIKYHLWRTLYPDCPHAIIHRPDHIKSIA